MAKNGWGCKLEGRLTYLQKGGTEILKSNGVDLLLMEAGGKVADTANASASKTLSLLGGGSLYSYDIKELDYTDGVLVHPTNMYGWIDNTQRQTLRKAAGIG